MLNVTLQESSSCLPLDSVHQCLLIRWPAGVSQLSDNKANTLALMKAVLPCSIANLQPPNTMFEKPAGADLR